MAVKSFQLLNTMEDSPCKVTGGDVYFLQGLATGSDRTGLVRPVVHTGLIFYNFKFQPANELSVIEIVFTYVNRDKHKLIRTP